MNSLIGPSITDDTLPLSGGRLLATNMGCRSAEREGG